MQADEIKAIVDRQRDYFRAGLTLRPEARLAALEKLRRVMVQYQDRVHEALREDLGKCETESFMCETGLSLSELSYMSRHLKTWSRDKRVKTPLTNFAGRSFVRPMPYGVTLIMSPWNYPYLLSIEPAIDAIAAGNTVVLKPSAYSPAVSALLAEMLELALPRELCAVVTGGRAENQSLLEQQFDYIFFTGSQAVGRHVLACASKHLTPVTLELGGKSPCIVDATAKLDLAARRIVFGKYLNCGQTCVAPDYILCRREVKDELIGHLIHEIRRQVGERPFENPEYGRIVNRKHYDRIMGLIDGDKVVWGGRGREESLQIEPTIMDGVSFEDAVMQQEIFGPVLPVIAVDSTEAIIDIVNAGQRPLALYVFSGDRETAQSITTRCAFGGGCINDTIIHLATSHMGFGGVGESGMGAYHGKTGFDTFSHYKSIVDKKTFIDLNMRYRPYTETGKKLVHMFLK